MTALSSSRPEARSAAAAERPTKSPITGEAPVRATTPTAVTTSSVVDPAIDRPCGGTPRQVRHATPLIAAAASPAVAAHRAATAAGRGSTATAATQATANHVAPVRRLCSNGLRSEPNTRRKASRLGACTRRAPSTKRATPQAEPSSTKRCARETPSAYATGTAHVAKCRALRASSRQSGASGAIARAGATPR